MNMAEIVGIGANLSIIYFLDSGNKHMRMFTYYDNEDEMRVETLVGGAC